MATPFQKQPITHGNYNNNSNDFHQAIANAGLTPPGRIIDDGQIHRFSSNGKRGDDAGWYVLYPDGIAAGAFGCWRLGLGQDWCSKSPDAMTPGERESHRKRMDNIKAQRETETKQRHKEAAEKAQKLWAEAEPVDAEHPYLVRKNVQSHGLRQIGDNLLLPITIDGKITSTQTIRPDGEKRFLTGGEKAGGHYLIGDATGTETLLIAEGFATAASLHEATALPMICALDAGNQ